MNRQYYALTLTISRRMPTVPDLDERRYNTRQLLCFAFLMIAISFRNRLLYHQSPLTKKYEILGRILPLDKALEDYHHRFSGWSLKKLVFVIIQLSSCFLFDYRNGREMR